MVHKIHSSARERILEIWEYTDRTWGEEQADAYVKGLFSELDGIAASDHLWKPVKEEGFEGVFFTRYRHHFVFFRRLSDGELGVITILHENMDIPERLKDDREDE